MDGDGGWDSMGFMDSCVFQRYHGSASPSFSLILVASKHFNVPEEPCSGGGGMGSDEMFPQPLLYSVCVHNWKWIELPIVTLRVPIVSLEGPPILPFKSLSLFSIMDL